MINDIGKRKWHRVFGWGTVTHPYTDKGSTLFDSDHKHIQHYVGGRTVDYIGTGKDGRIVSVFVNRDELFDHEKKDKIQAAMSILVKVIK